MLNHLHSRTFNLIESQTDRAATTNYSRSSEMSERSSVYIRVARVRTLVTVFICGSKTSKCGCSQMNTLLGRAAAEQLGSVCSHPSKAEASFPLIRSLVDVFLLIVSVTSLFRERLTFVNPN